VARTSAPRSLRAVHKTDVIHHSIPISLALQARAAKPLDASAAPPAQPRTHEKLVRMLIGAHVSKADGLARAIERGVERGCQSIQIFNQSPRMWRPTAYSEDDFAEFREAMSASPIDAVLIHAVYLVNCASADPDIRAKSVASLTHSLRAGARAIEQRAERGQALQTISYEDVLRDKVIVGTPESVTSRLQELIGKLGLNGVLAEPNCGGLIPNAKVMRSLQLMCEQVAPRFR